MHNLTFVHQFIPFCSPICSLTIWPPLDDTFGRLSRSMISLKRIQRCHQEVSSPSPGRSDLLFSMTSPSSPPLLRFPPIYFPPFCSRSLSLSLSISCLLFHGAENSTLFLGPDSCGHHIWRQWPLCSHPGLWINKRTLAHTHTHTKGHTLAPP